MDNWDNCNRDLVDYYADIADKPQEALEDRQAEMERRQDLFTRCLRCTRPGRFTTGTGPNPADAQDHRWSRRFLHRL